MHHRHAARPGVYGDVCGLQHVNRDLIPVGDDIRVRRGGAHRHEYSDRCDSNAPHGPLLARVLIDFVWTIEREANRASFRITHWVVPSTPARSPRGPRFRRAL